MSISNVNAKWIHLLTYLFSQYTFIDSVRYQVYKDQIKSWSFKKLSENVWQGKPN